MARVWYPSESTEGLARRPYFSEPELRVMEAGLAQALGVSPSLVRRLAAIETWSFEGAVPLVAAPASLPVVLFSHGFGCLVGNNTQLCEHLASHGYFVVSLAHPGSTAVVRYFDNSIEVIDEKWRRAVTRPELLKLAMNVLNAGTVYKRRRATLAWSTAAAQGGLEDVWLADSRACLDALGAGDCKPTSEQLLALADFSRVAAVGMSFGGSVSARLAQEDKRVQVAINLDGGQIGAELVNRNSRVPLLMLHSNALPMAMEGGFNDFHYESHDRAGLTPGIERALVDGAAHMDFTDWAVLRGGLTRRAFGLGSVEGRHMISLTCALCEAFLDRYLAGGQATTGEAVLPSLQEQWPEVKILDLTTVRELATGPLV